MNQLLALLRVVANPSAIAVVGGVTLGLAALIVFGQLAGSPAPASVMSAFRLLVGVFVAMSGAAHYVSLKGAVNGN